jgi:uncharacterized protein (DUF1800 family)
MAEDLKALNGAIAVTRFGLGARPGEIETASQDPRGWLRAQIRRDGADQPLPVTYPIQPRTPLRTLAASTRAPTGRAAAMTDMALATPAPAPTSTVGDMAAASVQPAVYTYDPGQSLPSMKAAFRVYGDYQIQQKAAKDDPERRKLAVAPLLEAAGEEILVRARLAAGTDAGFRERWTLFWSNHFTVSAKGLPETVAVGPFEREAIRPHVFGRFEDMLIASTGHPGMLLYLDQAQSIGPNSQAAFRRGGKAGLNENLAREILELHTLGADAGYTQADVTEFARALTGWSMGGENGPADQAGAFVYRADFHEPGMRVVMGKRYGDEGGYQALNILKALAVDPRTANRLARKIATHFVADDPPPALVARLRSAYNDSGGDLAVVAAALIDAPEAWDPQPRKFKTPYEFLISGYRAADVLPRDPAKEVVQPLTALGMRPFSAPQPNGWSELAADWAAPDAVVKRLAWAQGFAAAYAPQSPPVDEARSALGARLSAKTLQFVSRAETRQDAFAILLMSPEFQRR